MVSETSNSGEAPSSIKMTQKTYSLMRVCLKDNPKATLMIRETNFDPAVHVKLDDVPPTKEMKPRAKLATPAYGTETRDELKKCTVAVLLEMPEMDHVKKPAETKVKIINQIFEVRQRNDGKE